MNENEDVVLESLKRADHLINVSLKYTKTVDVIRNTILRLLEACDILIAEGLEYKKSKKKIREVPKTPKERAYLLYKVFKKKKNIKAYLDFFHLLRRIKNSSYGKKDEYRKNVAMLLVDDKDNYTEINVEMLKSFYSKTNEFVEFMREWINSGKE